MRIPKENRRHTLNPEENRGTSGKLRTVDTTVINHILWPHEVVYSSDGQPGMSEHLSCMAFVIGYLSMMALKPGNNKLRMSKGLQ